MWYIHVLSKPFLVAAKNQPLPQAAFYQLLFNGRDTNVPDELVFRDIIDADTAFYGAVNDIVTRSISFIHT